MDLVSILQNAGVNANTQQQARLLLISSMHFTCVAAPPRPCASCKLAGTRSLSAPCTPQQTGWLSRRLMQADGSYPQPTAPAHGLAYGMLPSVSQPAAAPGSDISGAFMNLLGQLKR